MNLVTGLSPDIVPHRRWAISKWYYANRLWYYSKVTNDDRIVINRRFYQLVDPELRDLCKVLHDHGLITTPSCQGHTYARDRFEKIWQELQRESQLITTIGLEVRDSETDQPFLFKDSNYKLPWPDFEAFFHAAADHQGIGYIGILLSADRAHVQPILDSLLIKHPTHEISTDAHIGRILNSPYYQIVVTSPDPLVRNLTWRQITRNISDVLKNPLPLPAGEGRGEGSPNEKRDIPSPPI